MNNAAEAYQYHVGDAIRLGLWDCFDVLKIAISCGLCLSKIVS